MSVKSSWNPPCSAAMFSTWMPAGMTSLPMPSPAITAMRWVFILCALSRSQAGPKTCLSATLPLAATNEKNGGEDQGRGHEPGERRVEPGIAAGNPEAYHEQCADPGGDGAQGLGRPGPA